MIQTALQLQYKMNCLTPHVGSKHSFHIVIAMLFELSNHVLGLGSSKGIAIIISNEPLGSENSFYILIPMPFELSNLVLVRVGWFKRHCNYNVK